MKKFLRTLMMTLMAVVPMSVIAFAAEPPVFDLTAIMTTAASKIVTDLVGMIAGVLPVMITLLAMSVGIAYGLRFIKSITKKAG